MITYRKAQPADLSEVLELLGSHHLPTSDVGQHFNEFILAVDDGRTVGCIGMEVYGSNALLRSLAVNKEYLGRKIGDHLYQQLIQEAGARHISKLHLLTTTAEQYFTKRGFALTQRDQSPDTIQATHEFSELCPSTARYMVKDIE
jgi:amino-acid N-acetyltransferase